MSDEATASTQGRVRANIDVGIDGKARPRRDPALGAQLLLVETDRTGKLDPCGGSSVAPVPGSVVIGQTRYPGASMGGRGQIRKDRGVLHRDLLLVVVTIGDPGAHLRSVEHAGNEPLVKWVLVVIALIADGVQPFDEAGAGDGGR